MNERDLIVSLLKLPSGVGVEMFMVLGACRLENYDFCVWQEAEIGTGVITEEVFVTAQEAADRFIQLRRERRLGIDFEATETFSVAGNNWKS